MITSRIYGKTSNDKEVIKYTLKNGEIEVGILNLGGTIESIKVPSNSGIIDVVLGYDDVQGYEHRDGYIGATIGRVGNRIGGAEFELNGKRYSLYKNNGNNHLHGGKVGFDKKIWDSKIDGDKLILEYLSVDGEENYPANLRVRIEYSLTADNSLVIEYFAESDDDTLCNLTNHVYFNLSGGERDILDTYISIDSDKITPVDKGLIPHGEFMDVSGTPFDLRTAKMIGDGIDGNHEQIAFCGGYDINYCLSGGNKYKKFCSAFDEKSGVKLEGYTTQEGVQFYSGNFLGGSIGKKGKKYEKRYGFCLETQGYPNAVNCKEYPSQVLKKGEKYHTKTAYKFSKI